MIRQGKPEEELVALAREVDANAIYCSDDVGPFARRRDARVRAACAEVGLELRAHQGLNAIAVDEISTEAGKPYTVFSPFYRAWLEADRRPLLNAPTELPALPAKLSKGRIPSLESLGLAQEVTDPAPGGETQARRALDRFLDGSVAEYGRGRDALGRQESSRLSPYLHFGCISPRQIENRLARGEGPRRSTVSSAGGTSTITCSPTSRATRARNFRIASAAGSPGVTPRSDSTPGAQGGPATRSSTRACANSLARVGCTTAPGSWSAPS